MRERITIQELIAMNNTPKAKALIVKYGYSPARNYDDLTYKLFRFTKEYGEEALSEMAKIHPHRDLIMNYDMPPVIKEEQSNFGGHHGQSCQCPSCRDERMMRGRFSNADGELNNKRTDTIKDMMPSMVLLGLVSAVLIVALKST